MAYLLSLIVNGVTRLQNDTHGTNIYADKHIKNNSNDNYILLGGGGHIDKGTFALANHGVHWDGFSKRATSGAIWGTLTSSNGYSPLFWLDSTNGGGVAFSDKSGQTSMQIDGYFYQNEGRYLVLDTNNYSSYLDNRYYTETEADNRFVNVSGDTMTGVLTMNTETGFQMKYTPGGNDPWMYAYGAPNYGIRYFEGSPDKMTLSASGNNNSISGADLCINGNGEGTVTIRGNSIWHAGNDGSGSGLDADTVDGYHVSAFATAGHTHAYLPLSGGTLSGGITFKYGANTTNQVIQFSSTDSSDPQTVYLGIRRPLSSYGPCYKDNNGNWYDLIHSGNYTTYTVKKDGTGASGTWGINISGNAATATNAPWSGITGKPTTFTPSAHTHTASDITGLPTKLSAFTNDVGYITGITKSMVEGVLTGNITSHTHSQYLTSALRPAKLFTREGTVFPPGYFIIKINNNTSEWMLSFDVKIVVPDGSYTIRFSEDNFTMSESWSSPSASMIDGENSIEVKFGYSRTNKWVAITSPDALVGISITNVANGYASVDTYDLDKLFTINFFGGDASELEYYLGTVQETITIYPPSKEGHTHTFASLTSKPTTINGYGITDALTTSNYNSYVPTRTGTGASGTWGISISGNAATATSAGTAGNADTVDNYHASNLTKFYLSPMSSGAPADSAKSWFINTMPSASGAIVYNVPGSEKTIIAGKSSGAHGHMLQLNYDDNYLRILRYYGGSWKTTDWEKISAGYADSAGSVAWGNVTGKPSTFTPSSHTHDYLPLSGGTMTGAINLSNTNAKLAFGSLGTSPITGYKAPSLVSNGVGIYSRYGGSSDEGAIIITEDTCVIYNSADTGWNFQVMDKDIGTDMTNDATRSFGVNQNHQAWSLAGFVKSGSSDSYVLLGGGGHKALSDFSMAHSHPYLPLSGGTCTGNIYAPAFYESSDERLKDFYNSIDVDLDKLSSLPKKFFKWKSKPNGEFEIGTSAQELQKIYPQLVNTDDKGYLTVAYDKLSIIALRAIDKLYEMNKNLERRIQILESKL